MPSTCKLGQNIRDSHYPEILLSGFKFFLLPNHVIMALPCFPDVSAITHMSLSESFWLEYKETTRSCAIEKVYSTICGFLNNGCGGYIVFGVRDSDHMITGINPTTKDVDSFILNIDNIYHSQRIVTVDNPHKSIAVGTVMSNIVSAANGTKHLLVITIKPIPGNVYTFAGTVWHRLGASIFSEATSKTESPLYKAQKECELLKSERTRLQLERDSLKVSVKMYQSESDKIRDTYNKLKRDYTAVVDFSKTAVIRVMETEKEVSELRDILYTEILRQKAHAEKVLESKRSMLSYLLCC